MASSCDCCTTPAAPAPGSGRCPVSGYPGKRVETATLRAQLSVSLRAVPTDTYWFCGDPDCEVVYFNTAASALFTEAHLRERVYQKHPTDPSAPVCYCFGHTVGALDTEHADSVVADIRDGIRAEQCACDCRNPQGSCCLGNVLGIVKSVHAS